MKQAISILTIVLLLATPAFSSIEKKKNHPLYKYNVTNNTKNNIIVNVDGGDVNLYYTVITPIKENSTPEPIKKSQALPISTLKEANLLAKKLTLPCSYDVNNNGSCNAIVNVDFYDTPSNVCQSYSGSFVPANSIVNFSCGTCLVVVNIVVTVTSIGGATLTGGTGWVDQSNVNDTGTLSSTGPCAGNSYSIDWHTNNCDVAP